jgi:hypothetical protein
MSDRRAAGGGGGGAAGGGVFPPLSFQQSFLPAAPAAAAGGGAGAFCALSGISTQQKLDEDIVKLQEVLSRGGGGGDAEKRLFEELNQIRQDLKKPSFLKTIENIYKKPLQNVIQRLLLQKIKTLLKAPLVMDGKFELSLKDCLSQLISATNYYIKLLFKSFYNNSKFRFLFGSGCTIIEFQVAYSALCYFLDNATFALTAGFVPNVRTLTTAFTTAYNSMTKATIETFLQSYGYTPEAATAIVATIMAVSAEQGKFILKGIFLKGVERFENRENHPAAAAAQPPPPSFLQFMNDPGSFFKKVVGAIPLPKLHLLIGAPDAAVSAQAAHTFERFVGYADDATIAQLRLAFPDEVDDVLIDILFKLLLGLSDEDYKDMDKFDIKYWFFNQKLKECLRDKYPELSDEEFNTLCSQQLPKLMRGITEEIMLRIYGSSPELSDSQKVEPSHSQPKDPGDLSLMAKLVEVFKNTTTSVWTHFNCFLGVITPEAAARPRPIMVSELEHPILELNKYIKELKSNNRDNEHFCTALDKCFESFKRTIHITTNKGEKVYVTVYSKDPNKDTGFGAACKDLYAVVRGMGEGVLNQVSTFFEMCFTVGYIVCNVSSDLVLPIPFGGNSVGASMGMADLYMNHIIDAQQIMIFQQRAAADDKEIIPDGAGAPAPVFGAGGGGAPAFGAPVFGAGAPAPVFGAGGGAPAFGDPAFGAGDGGGAATFASNAAADVMSSSSSKGGSKSRKNTKRTRRHSKGRKSSKAAKKTQQRRSSRHRRSSRKGRK